MSPLRILVVGFPPAGFLRSSSVAAPLACRSFSPFGLFHHTFFPEAQERGPERMEGRGFGGSGGFIWKFLLVYIGFFDMSEVLSSERFLADAKGQTNALVSKKSVSKFEAWIPADDQWWKGNRDHSNFSVYVCVCVYLCVILFKVEKKNPSKFFCRSVFFILNLTGKNADENGMKKNE